MKGRVRQDCWSEVDGRDERELAEFLIEGPPNVKVARAMAPLPSTRCQRGSRGGGTMKAECRRWKLRTRR